MFFTPKMAFFDPFFDFLKSRVPVIGFFKKAKKTVFGQKRVFLAFLKTLSLEAHFLKSQKIDKFSIFWPFLLRNWVWGSNFSINWIGTLSLAHAYLYFLLGSEGIDFDNFY